MSRLLSGEYQMTADSRNPDLISSLLNEARQTGILLAAALDQNHRVIAVLQSSLEGTVQQDVNAPIKPTDPAAEHRRNHRSGTLSRVVADPEIEAFIRARLDTLTLVQIVAEIAETFPPRRHISLSSLSQWWQATRPNPIRPASKFQL